MRYVRRCLIVPAAYAPLARALCAGLAEGSAGEGMLITPLSPSGEAPATHYISEGMIDDGLAYLLPLKTFVEDGTETTTHGHPDIIAEMANGAATLAQVTGLLAAVDVSEQSPATAIARLKLQMALVSAKS